MSTETYTATEDGTLSAVTIIRLGGVVLTFGYEDNAGAVDSVQPIPADDDPADYITWLTGECGYTRTEIPWNVYAVEIACDRGQWTYLASHNPAMSLEDWAREQSVLCAASPEVPWAVRVHHPDADADANPAGAPIAEVTGGR